MAYHLDRTNRLMASLMACRLDQIHRVGDYKMVACHLKQIYLERADLAFRLFMDFSQVMVTNLVKLGDH